MSYHTWITYGYGVKVDEIKTTPERLLKLAAEKPELLEKLTEFLNESLEEYEVEKLTLEDFEDFDTVNYSSGTGIVLYEAIDEFTVEYVDDYDGRTYVVFAQAYPWRMSEQEKALTENNVREVFEKYIKILTDEPVKVDYWIIENRG